MYAEHRKNMIYFVSGLLTTSILATLFTKAFRKLLMSVSLGLAFECAMKLIFAKRKKESKAADQFYENYVQIRDAETGEVVNRFVTEVEKKRYEKAGLIGGTK